uniref:NADH:ubiquinone reductase (H(+)-translocating) n=1 Tax=Parafilaroides normani TaxID=1519083 RepID=A0A075QTJ6_PARNR|nr:NADH dehydrogenase subunit 5 [Parafilaroides normani]AIG23800.1 NADH dehydrogenase subunit 5 [Parafilaroides normani]
MDFLVFLIVIFLFFILFVLFWVPFFNLGVYFFEWDFLSLKLVFDFKSFIFSVVLFLVVISVVFYGSYYLSGELNFVYYNFVLMVFVFSMLFLSLSGSAFTVMLSWDLLGISSFFLVLYYNNWDSNSGAMNTALTNRLGDFFMFVFFSSSLFSGLYFFSYSYLVLGFFVLMLLSSFTKSAQFPFSSWLPKAMSAPTPVSSLVHSSTLVTAGLILLMNFGFIILNFYFMFIMLVAGLFTMFFSSVLAVFEEDVKKVVALSTLSQMGFMMLTLGLGLHFVSFLHLLSHALFKSCLFMQIGYLIHNSFGQQDVRFYGNNGGLPLFVQVQCLVTLFCLCGLVFTSGMVSKDLILECFLSNDYFLFFFVVCSFCFLTFCYSYRLWSSFLVSFSKVVCSVDGSLLMSFFLSLVLVFFSVTFIYWMSLNLICLPSLFLFMEFFCLFLCFLIFLVLFFMSCFLELSYKFFVDYFNSYFQSYGLMWSFSFGLMKFGYNFYYLMSFFSKFFKCL